MWTYPSHGLTDIWFNIYCVVSYAALCYTHILIKSKIINVYITQIWVYQLLAISQQIYCKLLYFKSTIFLEGCHHIKNALIVVVAAITKCNGTDHWSKNSKPRSLHEKHGVKYFVLTCLLYLSKPSTICVQFRNSFFSTTISSSTEVTVQCTMIIGGGNNLEGQSFIYKYWVFFQQTFCWCQRFLLNLPFQEA